MDVFRKHYRCPLSDALFIGVFCLLLSFNACSSTVAPRYEVEVISPGRQAQEAIAETPLEFTVPYPEATLAQERVLLFLKRYCSELEVEQLKQEPRTALYTNRSADVDRFHYFVAVKPNNNGLHFRVRSLPNRSQSESDLALRNAHNVARFINSGQLELSLLAR